MKLKSKRERLQLKLQVKGLEKDVKTALFQIDEQTKKFKKEKKILEDVKIQLEKRCVRLQTRDTSYQAKIRKKEVEYEKLKERLLARGLNEDDLPRECLSSSEQDLLLRVSLEYENILNEIK